MSRYRSGKLPKAFKIIPALSNWEQVLYLTEPETWTAAAMYQATRYVGTIDMQLICGSISKDMSYLIWTVAVNKASVYCRIFSSNLKERMAQRFYNLVLLPRIRDDIAEYKKLNFHLYNALKKALFKPGAWFKGEILE